MLRVHPDIICHTGDLNNDIQAAPNVLIDNAPVFRTVPIAPVCGNHDTYQSFYEFFSMPMMERENKAGIVCAELMDYWFIKENVLFLGLNCAARNAAAHGEFVRRITAENPQVRWTVVMLHFSLFSNGSHARDALVLHFQNALAPVFQEADIDLVIGGHDHEYDRSLLYAGVDAVPGSDGSEICKAPGETLYLCIPTATGTKFYSRGPVEYNAAPAAEALHDEIGYVLADFTEDSLTVQAFSADGELMDCVVLSHAEA